MKQKIMIIPVFFLFMLTITSCEEKMPSDTSNISLHDKSLSVIKYCIQGKWRVVYASGGGSAVDTVYYTNFTVEFTSNNRVIEKREYSSEYVNTPIIWTKECKGTGYNACSYSMEFSNKPNTSNIYIIDKIKNDTLIYHDFASECYYYHLVKY